MKHFATHNIYVKYWPNHRRLEKWIFNFTLKNLPKSWFLILSKGRLGHLYTIEIYKSLLKTFLVLQKFSDLVEYCVIYFDQNQFKYKNLWKFSRVVIVRGCYLFSIYIFLQICKKKCWVLRGYRYRYSWINVSLQLFVQSILSCS